MKDAISKVEFLGVAIVSATAKRILEYVLDKIENSTENFYIVTPNPEIIVYANKNNSYKNILNQAHISLCDGVGLLWGSRILRKPIQERVNGVDMVEMLCKNVVRKPITVGFLGAGRGVAKKASDCLREKYPGLKVVYVSEEWEPDLGNMQKNAESSRSIVPGKFPRNSANIDILFVAFGFPKQEQWMHEHINKVPVRVMMGVGGAFDYISGNVPRSPKVIRQLGFEWLYRLIRQPWRWRRQLALIEFAWLVLKEKFEKS